MKKRLFSLCSLLLIACIACFGFAACGDDKDSEWKDSPLIGNWGGTYQHSNWYFSITYNKKTGNLDATHYQYNSDTREADILGTKTVSKSNKLGKDGYTFTNIYKFITYNSEKDILEDPELTASWFVRTTESAEEWFAEEH